MWDWTHEAGGMYHGLTRQHAGSAVLARVCAVVVLILQVWWSTPQLLTHGSGGI
jgi:hypothetical protein